MVLMIVLVIHVGIDVGVIHQYGMRQHNDVKLVRIINPTGIPVQDNANKQIVQKDLFMDIVVTHLVIDRILQQPVGHVDMCIRKKNHIGMVPNVRLVQVI